MALEVPAGESSDSPPRSVTVHGSAQGMVVGDHAIVTNIFQMYPDASSPLADPKLGIRSAEFEALIAERTRDFVGRDFIFHAIDNVLMSPSIRSGYVIIAGEPGVGKTTLAAELVKRRGWVHHFNIASQNIRSARDFLANVCAQLIVRHGLEHATLPPEALQDSGYLVRLLGEATGKASGEPVVVLVDALDEADDKGLPPETNVLYLPQTLPAGAYMVVTTRPRHDYRLFVDSAEDIFLDDASRQNLADVERYVRNFIAANQATMAERMAGWRVTEEDFVAAMIDRSEGNFMYLVYVIRDIRDGRLTTATIDSITDLPRGLREYYRRHWRKMREADPVLFDTVYAPIVCMLAAVKEPVSVADVAAWTKLESSRVTTVIREWREFLNEERRDGVILYRIYHASFRDFLNEEVGLTTSHERISDTAFAKIRW
jgi:hypothetical protein